jgi:hypothetical protein
MSQSPSPARPCGQLVRRDDPAIEISGTIERVTGCALVDQASLDARGRLELVYGGETKMYWEEQRPVRERDQLVFIDEKGLELLESEVLIRLAYGELVDPLKLAGGAS